MVKNNCKKRISGFNQDGTYVEMECGDFGYLCQECKSSDVSHAKGEGQ